MHTTYDSPTTTVVVSKINNKTHGCRWRRRRGGMNMGLIKVTNQIKHHLAGGQWPIVIVVVDVVACGLES